MAHREVYAVGTGRYGTRMLTAGERILMSGPAARAALALGRVTTEKPHRARKAVEPQDERPALRAEYEAKVGRKPYNGWDADTLREKIAAA
jgi:hypothetical protein